MKFKILLSVLYILLFLGANKNVVAQIKNDIATFNILKDRVQELALKNTDSAEIYANQLLQIAKQLQSDALNAEALSSMALIKIYRAKPDESLQLNQQSYEINKRLNIKKELAKNYYRFGTIYGNKSNFVEATKFYLQSVDIAEQEKMYVLAQKDYRKLSNIAINQEKFTEALQYAKKAIEVAKLAPADITDDAENLLNIATCFKYLKRYDEAETSFKAAFELYKKDNQQFKMADVLCEMAAIYDEKDLLKSISISLQAQSIFDSIAPDNITSINNMGNLGEGFFKLAQSDDLIKLNKNKAIPSSKKAILNTAVTYLTKAIELSKQQNISQAILYYSGVLSDAQAYSGDFEAAYKNLQFKFTYNDSLYSQENKNAIAKLESEKVVLALATENKEKAFFNKILIAATIALILLGILLFKNFSNKQKIAKQQQQLQQQQIIQLQKEKQLLAVDAMLKGQEDERSRIAKDLHDGLGGMLSGTKLSFMHMKENLVLTSENAILFDQSLKMLDNTMSDLRKVAHNLMPDALVKFGLQDALKDFCMGIKNTSSMQLSFQIVGQSRELSNTAQVFIYRIVQELVNNCLKHAQAKNLTVQLAYQTNAIGITVEDDGIGFDKNILTNNKGAGMQNIQYRVDYFNGTIDIDSTMNRGTSFNIDLKV